MTPAQVAHIMPTLPEPCMEDVPDELWGQNIIRPALFTAEQMKAYARAAVEAALRDAPTAEPQCRDDGRCQYAIDSGAEGMGHCPKGKCVMPGGAPTAVEPDERHNFEAAYRARYPVSCDLDPAKFNRSDEGDYEDIRVSIAWAMWQARALKGTPL